jgi:hypothetical protein
MNSPAQKNNIAFSFQLEYTIIRDARSCVSKIYRAKNCGVEVVKMKTKQYVSPVNLYRNSISDNIVKNHKFMRRLLSLLITSIVCVASAQADDNYHWLACTPIPDIIEVRLLNSQKNTIINAPNPRELDQLKQDNAIIIVPSLDYKKMLPPSLQSLAFSKDTNSKTIITKPSIYVLCTNPGSLVEDCIRKNLTPDYPISTNIETNNPIKKFDLSGKKTDEISGEVVTQTNFSIASKPWQLTKSEDYPNYWKFNGRVGIYTAGITAIISDKPVYFPIRKIHYYTCTLESDADFGTVNLLNESNKVYIKYIAGN